MATTVRFGYAVRLGVGVLLSALGAACTDDSVIETVPIDPQTMAAEVADVLNRYLIAEATVDRDEFLAAFAEDARFAWLEDGDIRYRTPMEFRNDQAARPDNTEILTRLEDIAVVPVGIDAAHAWARYTTTETEGDGTFTYEGAVSFVLERSGATWRIVGVHRSNVPQLIEGLEPEGLTGK